MVRIRCDDGREGVGYSYTIGTGGSSVTALLADHLAPRLIGRDPAQIEALWRDLLFATHATSVGAITSLALAAIDTALWDWRCRRDGQPLWKANVGGFVQAGPGFFEIPQVVNGASDMMVLAFADAGKHARSAVGVYRLPMNFAVEVDAVVEVR